MFSLRIVLKALNAITSVFCFCFDIRTSVKKAPKLLTYSLLAHHQVPLLHQVHHLLLAPHQVHLLHLAHHLVLLLHPVHHLLQAPHQVLLHLQVHLLHLVQGM